MTARDRGEAKPVRVRIAVAIDATGHWNASGWLGAADDDVMSVVVEVLGSGEARYWIEADIFKPVVQVIDGTVTEAS